MLAGRAHSVHVQNNMLMLQYLFNKLCIVYKSYILETRPMFSYTGILMSFSNKKQKNLGCNDYFSANPAKSANTSVVFIGTSRQMNKHIDMLPIGRSRVRQESVNCKCEKRDSKVTRVAIDKPSSLPIIE